MKTYTIIENGIEHLVEEYSDNHKYCYHKKKLHRENGPAIEGSDGSKFWYKHGKCHREDGPARIYNDGTEEYYLNGIYYPNVNSPEELIIASIII